MSRTPIVLTCLVILASVHTLSQDKVTSVPPGASPKDTLRIMIPPVLNFKPKLEFPPTAENAGVAGRIAVKGLINKSGNPVKTEIIKRDPEMSFMFDDDARRFFMKCRFSPAIDSSGNPVSCWVTIPINFRYEDFVAPVCEELFPPEYPEEALEMGLEGWVGVAVLVDERGSARDERSVVVARYPPETTVFDLPAKLAAKISKFRPASGRRGAEKGWCFVKVSFSLPGR